MNTTPNPPAHGVRLAWEAVPDSVRAAVEQWLGSPIVHVSSPQSGFSPGVAARVRTVDHRNVFIKVGGPVPNPDLPVIYRREAHIAALLPASAPIPRLLWTYDQDDWVVLVFEVIDGQHPAQPWVVDELHRVIDAIADLHADLTPSPLPSDIVPSMSDTLATRVNGWRLLQTEEPSRLDGLDEWSARHLDKLIELEAAAPAAAVGDTLLHFDIRADNMLVTAERVWFFDWPLASIGAAWVDMVFFAPSVAMQGGTPPEEVLMRHPASRHADPAHIIAVLAAVAGFFIHRSLQPPPPGLPTVRAFQAAQGVVARQWLAQRTGWI